MDKRNFKIDFLCVGFNKCGTSTLDAILREWEKIYLPENQKETFFVQWYKKCKNPMKEYQELYYPNYFNKNYYNRLIGSVEPSYYCKAKDVYECYGNDIKLIFMIREPIKATFSMFKMRLRKVHNKKYYEYYKKYDNAEKMFDQYINEFIEEKEERCFFYDEYFNEYLKYYKKDQIMVIILEEFIKNPQKILQDVSDFLNIKGNLYIDIPKINEGKKISKNYLCAKINYKLYRIETILRNKKPCYISKKFNRFEKIIYKITLIKNNTNITQKQKKILRKIYKNTIIKTSEIANRNLKDIWYGE